MRWIAVVIAITFGVLTSAEGAGLAEALPCGRVGSAGGLGGGIDMTRYTIDTARFPNAVCNDGTPAVFYYAPSTTEEDRGKWVIFLQGGGSCRDALTCAQRWCSIDTNFGMDKMTSSLSKESIRGNGFFDDRAANRFRTWNRVLVFYCSSDQWAGTSTRALTASQNGTSVEYTIQFKGSFIVDAVLDTLRNAPRGRLRAVRHDAVAGDASTPWPDLDDATDVLFAGSSGGGNGARNNADRVGARLRAANPALTEFRVLIDAIYAPQAENLDHSVTTFCATDPAACTYESATMATWTAVDRGLYAARGDQSCVTWHATNQPGTEWRCADNEHVLLHHLTTPFFLRHDLQDSNIGPKWAEAGFGTLSDYGSKIETELRNLPVPEEPRGATPGLFVAQCTDHEAFTDNSAVFEVRVDGLTFHDTVWNWWNGAQPQQAIRNFTGPGKAPDCP